MMDLKEENPLTSNRLRVYRFPMKTVFLVMGGALQMTPGDVFPEGCYLRGMKLEDEEGKLLVCISHLAFDPVTDGKIPIFDMEASLEPPPVSEPIKSDLLIL